MKKITFLLLHLNYGGLEKQTVTLINELAKSGKFEIDVISVYDILKGKSFYELDSNVNVKFLLSSGPNKNEIIADIKNFKVFNVIPKLFNLAKVVSLKYYLLKKEIKKINTDYIFSTRIEFANLIQRKDTINISQEHSYINTDKYISKIKKSFSNINYIIVMTDKAKELYESTNIKSKVIKISNIIDENNSLSDCLSKKIISVGRLEDVKNFTTLIEIFSKIYENHKDWQLEIVGSGIQYDKLNLQINKLNLSSAAEITQRVDFKEVQNKLQNSSIFVSTSKSESFSLAIVEAMNNGLPVVSFDIDVGPREIIQEGYNGFLSQNNDTLDMQNKIETLINDEKLRIEIGNHAKLSSEKYYSKNIMEEWYKILK